MLILDEFKGHLTPETKATITEVPWTQILLSYLGVEGGGTSKLQVLDFVVNKDDLKQLYNVWLLISNHALTPAGRIMKHTVTLVSGSQQHGKASYRSDFEGFQKVLYILSNGMTMKKTVMLAVNVRKIRH